MALVRGRGEVLGAIEVLFVLFLPIGEAVGVLHLLRAEARGFDKEIDSRLARLGKFALIGVVHDVCVCAAVACAVDDFLCPRELATQALNGG